MLDLRDDAITAWARSVLEEGGRVPEPSANDHCQHENVGDALARLGDLFEARGRSDPSALATSMSDPATLDELRAVFGQASRVALRFLGWLTEELPGGVELFLKLLDQRPAGVLGGLLAESQRSALLGRLFAPDRLRSLEEACRDATMVSEAA